ncbi:MAG: IS1182 family transposase [bacterium]|nr:IS1182 family transposase [bacterium]
MFMLSFEGFVDKESFVRVADAFVDAIDMKSFGFTNAGYKEEGRPAFHPAALMKLYLYGYRHGIRSSRKLQREAQTNLEAMWLLKGLHPHYKTIANFRKDNSKAFREVFRKFVLLLRDWELIEGNTVAIDSFKIRASNSLKNNFNDKKLQRHIQYIDEQIEQYQAQLDACDRQEDKEKLEQKLQEREQQKQQYQEIQQELEASGEQQISLTDADARAVVLHRNIVNVGYNVQAVSDEKHKLMVAFDTGAVNDTHALSPMALETKELLQIEQLTVLADKGYHTGKQLQACEKNNITTYVSPKAPSANTDSGYPITMFSYAKQTDTYICPQGHTMTTNGKWYIHSNSRKGRTDEHKFKRYLTPACKVCPVISLCTRSTVNGRAIDRSEYADAVENNNRRVGNNPDYYRKRQQITEHMFGTMKRQLGFTYTLVRGKEKVLGEVGLVFMVYNLVRCVSILRVPELINALFRGVYAFFNEKCGLFRDYLSSFTFADSKIRVKMNYAVMVLFCFAEIQFSYLYCL